jgi:hypothetical protein
LDPAPRPLLTTSPSKFAKVWNAMAKTYNLLAGNLPVWGAAVLKASATSSWLAVQLQPTQTPRSQLFSLEIFNPCPSSLTSANHDQATSTI